MVAGQHWRAAAFPLGNCCTVLELSLYPKAAEGPNYTKMLMYAKLQLHAKDSKLNFFLDESCGIFEVT